MALLRPYTDTCGNEYPASYWRAVQINIGSIDKAIHLVFYGYKDADSFASGRSPLPGASKTYSVNGNDFLAVAMSAPVGSTIYDVLAHATEAYALNKLDTPGGEVDEEGKPVLVSFFLGATQQ